MMHDFQTSDTIFAPSTAIGGAICVIRISGSDTYKAVRELLRKDLKPRTMSYALLKDHDEVIDACMAVWFPGPNSYSGENMLELHCHGGLQTVRRVSTALLSLGFRPAEGGEFTKRAFLNGKMDLTQAEAVMDVINAQADYSLRSALHQLGGGLRNRIEQIENLLLDIRSGIEAAIDYPDEAEEDFYAHLPEQLEQADEAVTALLSHAQQGRFLREGVRVVIMGRPNVGKSSVFNALLGTDRAIVTNIAGTTRDILDERMEIDGVSVRLMDTAGLRNAADEAESIGIDRARKALQYADLALVVLDGSEDLTEEDKDLLSQTSSIRRIVISNKKDIGMVKADLCVSCKTGEGIEELRQKIVAIADPQHVDVTSITNLRHIRALEQALSAIHTAKKQSELDCIATELREASHQLGVITGTDADDKLLDRIFERFCVGK